MIYIFSSQFSNKVRYLYRQRHRRNWFYTDKLVVIREFANSSTDIVTSCCIAKYRIPSPLTIVLILQIKWIFVITYFCLIYFIIVNKVIVSSLSCVLSFVFYDVIILSQGKFLLRGIYMYKSYLLTISIYNFTFPVLFDCFYHWLVCGLFLVNS